MYVYAYNPNNLFYIATHILSIYNKGHMKFCILYHVNTAQIQSYIL